MEWWKPDSNRHHTQLCMETTLCWDQKTGLRGAPKWFSLPDSSSPIEEPSTQSLQRSDGCRAAAVLSPSEGQEQPWGHVPNQWDSPPLRPRGSLAGMSESRPAPVFTIYSQSQHEAIAGSLESAAPAPRAPSPALASTIFLSFPLSPGSSPTG